MRKIRILFVNGGIMDLGGISSFMMNYYRQINNNIFQIDFIVHGHKKGIYDDELKEGGSKIYQVTLRRNSLIKNYKEIKTIMKDGNYDIVHSHLDAMNSYILKIAKKTGIDIRISHSHNTKHLTKNTFKLLINYLIKRRIKHYATHFLACSQPAAEWLYGKKIAINNTWIIKNAVDYDKYRFNKMKRNEVRKLHDIENSFLIGNIGRFDYQKNHIFLVRLFSEILKYIPNAKLVLIGDGHLKTMIIKEIHKLNLQDKVILTGYIMNVNDYYSAMDVFVFPSIFEGLGISIVEAQINGLKCFISNNVPSEVRISNNIITLSLNSIKDWSMSILECYTNQEYLRQTYKVNDSYTILENTLLLENYYQKTIKGLKQ